MHIRHTADPATQYTRPYILFKSMGVPYPLYPYDIVRPNLNVALTNNQQYFWRIRVELSVFNLLIVREAKT